MYVHTVRQGIFKGIKFHGSPAIEIYNFHGIIFVDNILLSHI